MNKRRAASSSKSRDIQSMGESNGSERIAMGSHARDVNSPKVG